MFSRKPIGWVYSDPPWSAGNLGYWRTHAGLEPAVQDYARFCARFAECIAMLEPVTVFAEQSVKDPDTLILAASRLPEWPSLRGRWTVRYGSPSRPNLLLRFAGSDWGGHPSGLADEPMTAHVFDHEPAAAEKRPVADPCIGKGMTARMSHARGIPCMGMELNPKRLATTLEWLGRNGAEVERL
jgi:hypothetical protein